MAAIDENKSDRPTILLTGFGPFPGVAANETGRLVPALTSAARAMFGDYAFHDEILPTEWSTAPSRLKELLDSNSPVLALHFGVAQDATGFRIECDSHNACQLIPDARGNIPPFSNLISGGALSQSATIPVEEIVRRLRGLGLPAYASNDAGRYLCNAVLYHSLCFSTSSRTRFRAGFVHIPTDLAGPLLTFEDALRGSLEIMKVCLEQPAL